MQSATYSGFRETPKRAPLAAPPLCGLKVSGESTSCRKRHPDHSARDHNLGGLIPLESIYHSLAAPGW